jgi:hypothetical protein
MSLGLPFIRAARVASIVSFFEGKLTRNPTGEGRPIEKASFLRMNCEKMTKDVIRLPEDNFSDRRLVEWGPNQLKESPMFVGCPGSSRLCGGDLAWAGEGRRGFFL